MTSLARLANRNFLENLVMDAKLIETLQEYQWETQPAAARLVQELAEDFCGNLSAVRVFADRLLNETGTRLSDWIDHFSVPRASDLVSRLTECRFAVTENENADTWEHHGGLFPVIRTTDSNRKCLTIKVESVADFLFAHRLDDIEIEGEPLSQLRWANVFSDGNYEFWVAERHGNRRFETLAIDETQTKAVLRHKEAFERRRRKFDTDEAGFDHATNLVRSAIDDLGTDWTCDLYFAAERKYWQSRNRAAQIQKARQDKLGLGWANHDHHTYRSSREHFKRLIAVLELLGFECRERFYGGREAGWGAQVLEQPRCGIVIFADVDLSPEEVAGDFAHDGLEPRSQLGTVGLWCKLHGEAFLQAGLHHLECQFEFDATRDQLAEAGVAAMKPFTDFDYLRQAFTEGEIWPVAEARITAALEAGYISVEQAERFRNEGSIGSHLEILQRDDGYKGFNQTGVSEIIRETDPRRIRSA
jgi:hypothetical protein